MAKSNGYILFEGASALDGQPIVVIAVGLAKASKNSKTGGMVQTYILRSDISPVEALNTGEDVSICGDCPHRGEREIAGLDGVLMSIQGGAKKRTCYVNIGQGAMSVWKAYKRGSYPLAEWDEFVDKPIRFGTYGDPAAAPFAVWDMLQMLASKTTGYTHQWRTIDPKWSGVVMASADTDADREAAHAAGYRTFRVTMDGEQPAKGEVLCPASEEAGKKLLCAQCGACNGTATGRKGSIYIPIHGTNSKANGQAALSSRLIARG